MAFRFEELLVFVVRLDAGSEVKQNCLSDGGFLDSRFLDYSVRFKSAPPTREFFGESHYRSPSLNDWEQTRFFLTQ